MEGQGDSSASFSNIKVDASAMADQGDAPTHTQSDEKEKLQGQTLASDSLETQALGQNSSTNESRQQTDTRENTAAEEQDDKEGSTDSQSEPFEIVSKTDTDNNSDDSQGEITSKDKTESKSDFDPNSVKENDVQKETKKDEESYVDILGNGLLKKKVLKQGGGRPTRPNHGDNVTLNVEGRLDDDTVVDKNNETEFILGDGDVIQAWDLAVSLMELGEKCELITASKYAYGEVGRDPDIPSNARITYTLELTHVEETPKLSELTVQERLAKGEAKRERGNFLFTRKDFTGAINSYSKGLTILQYPGSSKGAESDTLEKLLECQLKCSNNLAACQLKIEAYDAAIRSCESVLKTQPDNVKALYRIGKAYGAKGENEDAVMYLRKAIKLDPSSKILHAEMSSLTNKMKKENDSERKMYRRMMGTDDKSTKKQTGKSWWKVPVVFGGVLAGIVSVGLAVAYRYGQH